MTWTLDIVDDTVWPRFMITIFDMVLTFDFVDDTVWPRILIMDMIFDIIWTPDFVDDMFCDMDVEMMLIWDFIHDMFSDMIFEMLPDLDDDMFWISIILFDMILDMVWIVYFVDNMDWLWNMLNDMIFDTDFDVDMDWLRTMFSIYIFGVLGHKGNFGLTFESDDSACIYICIFGHKGMCCVNFLLLVRIVSSDYDFRIIGSTGDFVTWYLVLAMYFTTDCLNGGLTRIYVWNIFGHKGMCCVNVLFSVGIVSSDYAFRMISSSSDIVTRCLVFTVNFTTDWFNGGIS